MNEQIFHITAIHHTGHGIAMSIDNDPVYILGTFPGDTVRARIYKKAEGKTYAEILKIIEPSPARAHTPTKYLFYNANTPWESLSMESENGFKTQIFKDIYESHVDGKNISNVSFSEKLLETAYRNKVAYSFMHKNNSQKSLCFALYTRGVKNNTVQKIPQEHNNLVQPILEKVGKQFLHFFNQKNISAEDLKYLILRYSYLENNVVAHILVPETNRKKIPFKKSELENFLSQQPMLKGVLVSSSPANVRSAATEKDFYSLGDIVITEQVLNKKYTYHPSLFFQIYPAAFAEILSDARGVLETIPDVKTFSLLDLFAGVGVIGLELADLVRDVTGVELSSLSKQYALENAQTNNIQNYNFIESSVDDVLDHIQADQILVIDPTRAGLSKETIQVIIDKKPKYILYISCNPVSQERDIELMKDFYEITFIKAYNIFPKTHHIESMIVLKKK